MSEKAGLRVKFAERGAQNSRIQTVGSATLSQLSIAEVAVSGFRSAGIAAAEPRTLRVDAEHVAPDQRIIAPCVALGI